MVDLRLFKPKRTDDIKLDKSATICDNCSQIKLVSDIDNLARFLLLDDDSRLWADESCLYKYVDFINSKINCWQENNQGKNIKSVKQFTDIVLLEAELSEQNILHLRSFCIKEWTKYNAALQNKQ